MAVSGFGMPGPMEMIMVLAQLLGGLGAGPMPVSTPPQPEMPVMQQIAPDDCLAYYSMAGMATPDPKSTNQTEQLMAEPDVQAFFKEVDRTVQRAIRVNMRGESPEEQQTVETFYELAKQMLTHPSAGFVGDLQIDEDGPKSVEIGVMMHLGDDADTWHDRLLTLYNVALKENPPIESGDVMIDGLTFHRIVPDDMNQMPITWGVCDGMLMLAVGDDVIEGMIQRMQTPAPAWLTEIGEQLPIERRATLFYTNVEKLKQIILDAVPQDEQADIDKVLAIIEALGLDNLKAIKSATGLDETGLAEMSLIEFDGPVRGVPAALFSERLTTDDLANIPVDSNLLIAGKLNLPLIYETAIDVAEKIEPGSSRMITMTADQGAKSASFDDAKTMLGAIGKTWTLYNSPSEGGTLLTGLTMTNDIDEEAFKPLHDQMLETFRDMKRVDDVRMPQIVTHKSGNKTYHTLLVPDEVFPFAPSWTIVDGRLVVSAIPQNIRAYLSRKKRFKSIDMQPVLSDQLGAESGPAILAYVDGTEGLKLVYPLLPYFAQMASNEMSDELGVPINAGAIPSLASILPHSGPGVRSVTMVDDGILIQTRSNLPGSSMSLGTVPLAVAFFLPAVQASREAARRAQCMNNMKQIALAMHNYHDTFNSLPIASGRKDAFDENGKPLLSWRVHILPYIDQSGLYEQFHLDEPWDSEHNIKLIDRMPAIYACPSSPSNMLEHKTPYQTIRADYSAFPEGAGLSFAKITDGTSNTIMVVEAPQDKAVIWTKPDDYKPGEEPEGWHSAHPGGFNAVICDGSVRFISEWIDPETLKALMTRAGGEVVNYDEY